MAVGKASCIYRGNTFYCTFAAIGAGPTEEVRIRYHGEELTAKTGGRPIRGVAEALLREAVTLEAISLKVAASAPAGAAPMTRSDARDRRLAA